MAERNTEVLVRIPDPKSMNSDLQKVEDALRAFKNEGRPIEELSNSPSMVVLIQITHTHVKVTRGDDELANVEKYLPILKVCIKALQLCVNELRENPALAKEIAIRINITVISLSQFAFKKFVKTGCEETVEKSVQAIAKETVEESVQFVGVETAKKATAKGVAETTKNIGKLNRAAASAQTAFYSSAVTDVGFLAVSTSYYIYQFKNDSITREQLDEHIAKGVVGTGGSILGTTAGAFVGSFLFPGVGTFLGGFFGGMLGDVVGSKGGQALYNRLSAS